MSPLRTITWLVCAETGVVLFRILLELVVVGDFAFGDFELGFFALSYEWRFLKTDNGSDEGEVLGEGLGFGGGGVKADLYRTLVTTQRLRSYKTTEEGKLSQNMDDD